MADLSNLQISESFQRVLQRDPTTGFLQDLVGDAPTNIIFNGTTLRYVDGNQQNGYVLTSDANGNASWAAAGGGGVDVYWSSSTANANAIVNSGLTTSKVGIGTTIPNHELSVSGTVSASTSYVVGNATLTTSELDISSGNFTLDVEGDITLDANGADILLQDDGTEFGRFKRDTSNFIIKSAENNKDIIFRGQDGGVTIDALTLDMSEAGEALFNDNIVLNVNNKYIEARETDATARRILGINSSDNVIVSDPNLPTEVKGTNIRLSAKTFIGTIDAAGANYDVDKILVAQGDGEVNYLTTAELKADIADADYWTASTANANAIVNSGMTTSKVGIGTTIPNHELSISGSMSASSSVFSEQITVTGTGENFFGGDINLIAADIVLDNNQKILFNNTSGVEKGNIFLNSSNQMMLQNQVGGGTLILRAGTSGNKGKVEVRAGGSTDVIADFGATGGLSLVGDLGVTGNTYIGDIAAAGSSYSNNEILVAQSNGKVEYLTTAELKEDIGIPEYWSASSANANAIVNSGMTTSKVGIGTTIPNHELSVSGSVSATSTVYGFNLEIGDDRYIGSASDTDAIQIAADGKVTISQNLKVDGDILQTDTDSIFNNGAYLEIGTGFANTGQLTFNANHDGGVSTNTYTPVFAGNSNAGMTVVKMPSGGYGGLEFYVKNHGTTSGSQNLSTFTKILDLNQDGNSTFGGKVLIGSIDNAGPSYGEDKILVAQSDGEVEYLTRTDLANYLSIRDYFTASTANANAIVNSGMTTSKVGIGTTIPNHELSVSGSVSATTSLLVGTGHAGFTATTSRTNIRSNAIDFIDPAWANDVVRGFRIDNVSPFALFITKGDASAAIMKIDSGSNPALSLTGSFKTTADVVIGDDRYIGSASDTDAIQIKGNGNVAFSQNLLLFDDKKINLGSGGDGQIYVTSDDLYMQNVTANKSIIFKGNDGGSAVNALTLDMSTSGLASFAGSIAVSGAVKQYDGSATPNYGPFGGQGSQSTVFLTPQDFVSTALSIASGGRNAAGYIRGPGYLYAGTADQPQYATYVVPLGYSMTRAACYASAGECNVYSGSPLNSINSTAKSAIAVQSSAGNCATFTTLDTSVVADGCGAYVIVEWIPNATADGFYGAGLVMESV